MIKPMRLHFITTFVVCILLVAGCVAQSAPRPRSEQENSLKRFLQDYDGNPTSAHERTARYSAAFVDLRGDGTQEVIVYLMGGGWCGSGGCSTLILTPNGSSYRAITRITV